MGCSSSYGGASSKERGTLTSVIDAAAGQPQTRDESNSSSPAFTNTSEDLESFETRNTPKFIVAQYILATEPDSATAQQPQQSRAHHEVVALLCHLSGVAQSI